MHSMLKDGTPRRAAITIVLASLAGCAAPGARPRESTREWEPVVVWSGKDAFERVRVGRPDPSDPKLQIVGVDQGGNVVLVHYDGGAPRAGVIHRHPSELTGLVVDDVDPDVPGEEIYVGGAESGESGGSVTQLVVTSGGARARRIWTGGAYVHSIERVDAGGGRPAGLLVSTYAGEIHRLAPTAAPQPWSDQLLFKDPPASDVETPKIKDAAFLRTKGGGPRTRALVAFKTGRLLLLDLDHPEAVRVLLNEPGGLSRVTADADGGAYVTGYAGRALHFAPDGADFKVEELDREGATSGLRGIVVGRFPLPQGGTAPLALFGFHALVRALTPSFGAWDVTTLYRDVDRGHTIEAADLVPGNDADELIVSGYSKRITVLVARPRSRRRGRITSRKLLRSSRRPRRGDATP